MGSDSRTISWKTERTRRGRKVLSEVCFIRETWPVYYSSRGVEVGMLVFASGPFLPHEYKDVSGKLWVLDLEVVI